MAKDQGSLPRRLVWLGVALLGLCMLNQLGNVQVLSGLLPFAGLTLCENPKYTARILSYDPLMIHFEDFITPAERRHLLTT